MSETSSTTLGGTGAGSTAGSSTGSPTNAAGSSAGALYGPSGERLSSGWRQNRAQSDQIGDFVMQQPMTAALVALVVGYFLGKLT